MKVSKLLKLSGIKMNDYILSLDEDVRSNLLKNAEIRNFYLKKENHNCFIWIIYDLSPKNLISFLDKEMIDLIFNDEIYKNEIYYNLAYEKLNVILEINNEAKNIVLNNDKIIKMIIDDKRVTLKMYIDSLNEEITYKLIDTILINNNFDSLKYLNQDIFYNLLLNEHLVNNFINLNYKKIINYLPIKSLNNLLNMPYFRECLLSVDILDIINLIDKDLTFPTTYTNDEEFLNKYLKIPDIQERRFYINKFQKNNYHIYDELNKRLNSSYNDFFLNGYSKLKEQYNFINDDEKDMFKKEVSENSLHILIDNFFQDFDFNILINIQNMLNFNEKINNILIDEHRVNLYNQILNFDKYTLEEQKQIYLKMPKEISEYLYEDFRNCQNYSYKLINQEIVDVTKLQQNEKNGVKIYYLDGEKFILPVHSTHFSKGSQVNWKEDGMKSTLSISLIGNECIDTYRKGESILIGFKSLNSDDIIHVYHSDSFSSGKNKTDRINEIFTPHDLLRKTKGYNEILIAQKILNNKIMKPDYVVCYDNVTDDDIEAAIGLGNIPIIVINMKRYSMGIGGLDYNNNIYIDSISDYQEKNTKK